nr:hypothetical protein [Tanacetum cinerariifolium]
MLCCYGIIIENVLPPNNNPNVPEEEPILDQALAALVRFTPQWIGGQIPNNNSGWLEEDLDEDEEEYPEEEPEEEEIKDEDMIANVDDVPIPHDIQFGCNFYIGEISAMRDLLTGNSEVNAHGPMCCDLKSVHRGVMKLSKQMHDRIMPPKRRSQTNPQPTLTQEAVDQLVRDRIEAATRDERERVRMEATRAGGPVGGPAAAPMA